MREGEREVKGMGREREKEEMEGIEGGRRRVEFDNIISTHTQHVKEFTKWVLKAYEQVLHMAVFFKCLLYINLYSYLHSLYLPTSYLGAYIIIY